MVIPWEDFLLDKKKERRELVKKSIYKIENLINHRIYIGQTNNVKRHFMEHKRGIDPNSDGNEKVLYKAMRKYGINNFSFEVIEETEDYNEREKYWIDYYDSFNNGYNMTIGGDEPPIFYGENHPQATHSLDEINNIIELLRNTSLSIEEIAKQTCYNTTSINRINKGELWKNEELDYPIRKEITHQWKRERAIKIIYDLKHTSLTQREIAEKYGVARTAVTAINRGVNCRVENENYPIRK